MASAPMQTSLNYSMITSIWLPNTFQNISGHVDGYVFRMLDLLVTLVINKPDFLYSRKELQKSKTKIFINRV